MVEIDFIIVLVRNLKDVVFAGKSKYQMFTGNTDVFLGIVS